MQKRGNIEILTLICLYQNNNLKVLSYRLGINPSFTSVVLKTPGIYIFSDVTERSSLTLVQVTFRRQ